MKERIEELARELTVKLVGELYGTAEYADANRAITTAVDEALEAAAMKCDSMDEASYPDKKPFGHDYAEAIRNLKVTSAGSNPAHGTNRR